MGATYYDMYQLISTFWTSWLQCSIAFHLLQRTYIIYRIVSDMKM